MERLLPLLMLTMEFSITSSWAGALLKTFEYPFASIHWLLFLRLSVFSKAPSTADWLPKFLDPVSQTCRNIRRRRTIAPPLLHEDLITRILGSFPRPRDAALEVKS